tara:strand:- start:994 stop:1854 length:861 start_codon:yes stop_codon:yes gene_type:complete
MRKLKVLFFAILIFIIGYSTNSYKNNIKWKINNFLINFKFSSKECLNEIKEIPINSIAIIGHAYGSPLNSILREDEGISLKLSNFLRDNSSKIDEIVFSGDVLHNPTLKRWNQLLKEIKQFKIYIAPGNHDIGLGNDTAKRDIFKIISKNNLLNYEYPNFFIKDKSLFILDDSNLSEHNLKKIKEIISNKNAFTKIFIIRHHILTKSMREFSNGIPFHPLIKENFLNKELEIFKEKDITFIYGDGGKFSLYCKQIGNARHLINGIGEKKEDKILIFNKNKLYFKSI